MKSSHGADTADTSADGNFEGGETGDNHGGRISLILPPWDNLCQS